MELAIDSSGPTRHLVVDNVDLLELLLQLVVVPRLLRYHLLHLQYVFVLELILSRFLSSCLLGIGIDLKLMQSNVELLVVLLQHVDLLVALADVLQQVRVSLLPRQETLD